MADDNDEHLVGYGKPPKATQFKPNQSGNPRGRPPKQERSISRRQLRRDVLTALEAPVIITVDGKQRTITINEALVQKLAHIALRGDLRAMKLLIDLRGDLTREHSEAHPGLAGPLETGEQRFTEDQTERLDPESLRIYNDFRRRTRKV